MWCVLGRGWDGRVGRVRSGWLRNCYWYLSTYFPSPLPLILHSFSTSPPFQIKQELREWLANPMDNLHVAVGDNLRVWVVTLTGAKGTIFAGEKYKLKVRTADLEVGRRLFCLCLCVVVDGWVWL